LSPAGGEVGVGYFFYAGEGHFLIIRFGVHGDWIRERWGLVQRCDVGSERQDDRDSRRIGKDTFPPVLMERGGRRFASRMPTFGAMKPRRRWGTQFRRGAVK
jgi:hypothetical protein